MESSIKLLNENSFGGTIGAFSTTAASTATTTTSFTMNSVIINPAVLYIVLGMTDEWQIKAHLASGVVF